MTLPVVVRAPATATTPAPFGARLMFWPFVLAIFTGWSVGPVTCEIAPRPVVQVRTEPAFCPDSAPADVMYHLFAGVTDPAGAVANAILVGSAPSPGAASASAVTQAPFSESAESVRSPWK